MFCIRTIARVGIGQKGADSLLERDPRSSQRDLERLVGPEGSRYPAEASPRGFGIFVS
jgi:hypothetical protein